MDTVEHAQPNQCSARNGLQPTSRTINQHQPTAQILANQQWLGNCLGLTPALPGHGRDPSSGFRSFEWSLSVRWKSWNISYVPSYSPPPSSSSFSVCCSSCRFLIHKKSDSGHPLVHPFWAIIPRDVALHLGTSPRHRFDRCQCR